MQGVSWWIDEIRVSSYLWSANVKLRIEHADVTERRADLNTSRQISNESDGSGQVRHEARYLHRGRGVVTDSAVTADL